MKIMIQYEYDSSYQRYFASTRVNGEYMLRGGDSFEEARETLLRDVKEAVGSLPTRSAEEVEI
jgi:hypothetical protein